MNLEVGNEGWGLGESSGTRHALVVAIDEAQHIGALWPTGSGERLGLGIGLMQAFKNFIHKTIYL